MDFSGEEKDRVWLNISCRTNWTGTVARKESPAVQDGLTPTQPAGCGHTPEATSSSYTTTFPVESRGRHWCNSKSKLSCPFLPQVLVNQQLSWALKGKMYLGEPYGYSEGCMLQSMDGAFPWVCRRDRFAEDGGMETARPILSCSVLAFASAADLTPGLHWRIPSCCWLVTTADLTTYCSSLSSWLCAPHRSSQVRLQPGRCWQPLSQVSQEGAPAPAGTVKAMLSKSQLEVVHP